MVSRRVCCRQQKVYLIRWAGIQALGAGILFGFRHNLLLPLLLEAYYKEVQQLSNTQ